MSFPEGFLDDTTATWNDIGGLYIFTYLNAQNRWPALYVGIADSFKNRLPNHERWSEARRGLGPPTSMRGWNRKRPPGFE